MPRIFIPPKKVYKRLKTESKRDNLNHIAVYNTTTWKTLRLEKLKKDPLCERCLKKGVIRSARDVHHKKPISTGKTKAEKQALGFSLVNLESICTPCHKEAHT